MDTDTRTEADTIGAILESAAAWWQLASRELTAGNLDMAARCARLGRIGTSGMREQIEAMSQDTEPSHRDGSKTRVDVAS